jgi:hypothetical protein
MVRHAAIDWDRVFGNVELIVDTVNASAGRAIGDRQVLLLGAGWAGNRAAVRAGEEPALRPA